MEKKKQKNKKNLHRNVGEVEVDDLFHADGSKNLHGWVFSHVLFYFIVFAGIHEVTSVQKVRKRRFTTSKIWRLPFSSSRGSLKMKLTQAETFSQHFVTFLSMLKAMHQVLLAIEHQPISS